MIVVTGAAGFIGFHLCSALLRAGHRVVGIDALTSYYDVSLKKMRRDRLKFAGLDFIEADLVCLPEIMVTRPEIWDAEYVFHLAAQPGVRFSIENPRSYVQANLDSFVEVLEYVRHNKSLKHFIYASSSSVYGLNRKLPYSIHDRTDNPKSFYGATKKAGEVLAYSYASLYGVPSTGFRFFTVYGPWGRPDMAPMIFANAIMQRKPIRLFNYGNIKRDFTYIDDIVGGLLGSLDRAPEEDAEGVPHALFNLGNSHPEKVPDFIDALSAAIGVAPIIEKVPAQPGDVQATWADIRATTEAFGYLPKTNIQDGTCRFVEWYREYVT